MKIGTGTIVSVGERWVGAFREPGSTKFRIANVSYERAEGKYDVLVILIPAGTLPPAAKVEAE
jgi:hypothetical protein